MTYEDSVARRAMVLTRRAEVLLEFLGAAESVKTAAGALSFARRAARLRKKIVDEIYLPAYAAGSFEKNRDAEVAWLSDIIDTCDSDIVDIVKLGEIMDSVPGSRDEEPIDQAARRVLSAKLELSRAVADVQTATIEPPFLRRHVREELEMRRLDGLSVEDILASVKRRLRLIGRFEIADDGNAIAYVDGWNGWRNDGKTWTRTPRKYAATFSVAVDAVEENPLP